MAGTNNRIAAFILLSLGLHALLLVPSIGKQLTATVAPSLGTLSVSLQPPPPKPEHNQIKTLFKQKLRTETASSNPQHSPSGQHSIESSMQARESKPSHAANLIKHEVLTRLRTQFEYPLMAIRHGWQGDVQLSFRVLANGTLTNIQIAHSSGYALLDRSAINALRRIHRLQESKQWLGGQHLDMTVPIRYQLTEG